MTRGDDALKCKVAMVHRVVAYTNIKKLLFEEFSDLCSIYRYTHYSPTDHVLYYQLTKVRGNVRTP